MQNTCKQYTAKEDNQLTINDCLNSMTVITLYGNTECIEILARWPLLWPWICFASHTYL